MAVLAAYAALELAGRIPAARGRQRYLWLAGSATTLGIGIWSMHFIGMLGFRLPVAVQYDVLTTLTSLLVAVAGSVLALLLVSRPHLRGWQLGLGGLLQGGAIAGMHYLGMAAMRLPARLSYQPAWFVLSVVIAAVASWTALWLAVRFRTTVTRREAIGKAVSGVVMGLAIAGMHYTGMRAAIFTSDPSLPSNPPGAVAVTVLGALASGALLVLAFVLIASLIQRQVSHLTYPWKFTLISLLFALPLALVTIFLYLDRADRIDRYGVREKYGLQYLQPLNQIQRLIYAHQWALHEQAGLAAGPGSLADTRQRMAAAFDALDSLEAQYNTRLQTGNRAILLRYHWGALEARAVTMGELQRSAAHTQFALEVHDFISWIGEHSNLLLDPELDTHYLRDAVLLRLPEAQTVTAETFLLGAELIRRGEATPGERSRLLAAIVLLRANWRALDAGLITAFSRDTTGRTEAMVSGPKREFDSALKAFIDAVEQQLVNAPSVTLAEATYVAAAQRALAANAALFEAASAALELGIDERIADLVEQQRLVVAFAVLASLVAFSIGIRFMRAISRPLQQLTEATRRLAAGDMSVRAAHTGADEVGQVGRSFNAMAEQLSLSQEQLAARNRALATLLEVSRRLSTVLDEAQLVREVVEQIKAAFGYYHAHIYLFDATRENLVLAGGTGPAGAALLARGHKLPRGKGLVGRAAETNAPVYAPHTARDPGWLPNPLLPETQAEIAVPLAVGGEVLGVLDVQHSVAGGLSPSDVETLQNIGNQTAVALRNARSYARAQRQAEREARLNAISRKIRSAVSLEAVLETAARELGQALQARAATAELNLRPVLERPPTTGVAETVNQAGNGKSRS